MEQCTNLLQELSPF